jgi:hypothetical protein
VVQFSLPTNRCLWAVSICSFEEAKPRAVASLVPDNITKAENGGNTEFAGAKTGVESVAI